MYPSRLQQSSALSGALLWHERIVTGLGHAAGWAFGIAAILICADIGVRYFELGALPWVIELTEYLMFAAAFLGAPWVLRQNGHVSLDILVAKLPSAAARRVEMVTWLVGLAASLAMVFFGGEAAISAWRDNMVTVKTWRYEEWLLLSPIALSGLLMSIEFAARFVAPPAQGPRDPIHAALP